MFTCALPALASEPLPKAPQLNLTDRAASERRLWRWTHCRSAVQHARVRDGSSQRTAPRCYQSN